MTRTILGHEVRRVEDPDLLRGTSRFVADLPADGMLHAVFEKCPVFGGKVVNANLDEMAAYVLTIDSGIADIAGGELTLAEPIAVGFTTGEIMP